MTPMDLLQSYTFTVVDILAVLTAGSHVLLLTLVICLILEYVRKRPSPLVSWCAHHGLLLMLIVATVATLGSFFLSEIAGWNPCKYCWLQRIFMYPQVILLGIALWKRDTKIAPYILALCIVGAAIAKYHYFIQLYDIVASPTNPATPCDASGESCVKTPFLIFGYITIPMMALTAFFLNSLGAICLLRRQTR